MAALASQRASPPSQARGSFLRYRGAYTDLRDLIRLRHAARDVADLGGSKAANPLAGLLTSRFRGRGIDFAEVRVYQPGDDVRTIDWKVTARTQVAHTKLFQEEKERPAFILLDQSASMHFGSAVCFKSVLGARAAALLAWAALERGDRTGGLVFSEARHSEVRPRRSRHSVLRLLHEAHDFNHALGRSANEGSAGPKEAQETAPNYFADALANLRRVARHGSLVFIISDFANYGPEAWLHLQPLAQRNEVIGVHISDPLEQSLPAPDVYAISDGRQRTRINTASRQHRSAYQAAYQRRYQELSDAFQRVKSPLLPLSTAEPLTEGLGASQTAAA